MSLGTHSRDRSRVESADDWPAFERPQALLPSTAGACKNSTALSILWTSFQSSFSQGAHACRLRMGHSACITFPPWSSYVMSHAFARPFRSLLISLACGGGLLTPKASDVAAQEIQAPA